MGCVRTDRNIWIYTVLGVTYRGLPLSPVDDNNNNNNTIIDVRTDGNIFIPIGAWSRLSRTNYDTQYHITNGYTKSSSDHLTWIYTCNVHTTIKLYVCECILRLCRRMKEYKYIVLNIFNAFFCFSFCQFQELRESCLIPTCHSNIFYMFYGDSETWQRFFLCSAFESAINYYEYMICNHTIFQRRGTSLIYICVCV